MHDENFHSALPQKRLAPDARIIRPEAQPQSYEHLIQSRALSQAPTTVRTAAASSLPGLILSELLSTVLPALLIAIFIHLFLAQATRVEGYSMEPTLQDHQRVIIEKISYRLHPPRRDDIVVVRPDYNGNRLIKRVIGLPGDTIEIRGGVLYINGEPFSESYVATTMRGTFPPTVVPPGHVFVMGDNRNNSSDSRSFGPVSLDSIVGRAWLRYWPLSEFGLLH